MLLTAQTKANVSHSNGEGESSCCGEGWLEQLVWWQWQQPGLQLNNFAEPSLQVSFLLTPANA